MKTYSEFTEEHPDRFFWCCEANGVNLPRGEQLLDVLVYDTEEDLEADDDNSLAIARATVIDDRPE